MMTAMESATNAASGVRPVFKQNSARLYKCLHAQPTSITISLTPQSISMCHLCSGAVQGLQGKALRRGPVHARGCHLLQHLQVS